MDRPHAGTHYQRSVGELQAWFRTDADCLDYLEWLRWPAGFVCAECGQRQRLAAGRWTLQVLRVRRPDVGDGGHCL